MSIPAVYRDRQTIYYADTCEPLKAAAARRELRLSGWAHPPYPGNHFPPRMLPEVRSVGVWDATRTQRWGLEPHCNEGIELTYLARGRLAFAVGAQQWEVRSGQLTITRPWQMHSVGAPYVTPSRLCWVILDVGVRRPNQPWRWPDWLLGSATDLARLATFLRQNEQPVWPADATCAYCFERLAELLPTTDAAMLETRLKLAINELLVALLDMLDRRNIPLDETLTSSRRTVEVFLKSLPSRVEQPWTLAHMAAECGLKRTQFTRYCCEISNMTPIAYLNQCRMGAAARLLVEQPERSITDIAFSCGFQSSQYFTTVFQAMYGCAPSVYRMQRRSANILL